MNESSHSPQEIREAVARYQVKSADLEFPVAPAFDSRPPRMTPTEHLLWCEEMIRLGVVIVDKKERLEEKQITAEFVL
jgi:hypothetical protein